MGRTRGRKPAYLSGKSEKTIRMLSTFSFQNDENGRQRLEELRMHIRNLSVRILDLNLKLFEQSKNINVIIDDLKMTFPKIFARGTKAQLQKRIKAVNFYISKHHAARRYREKARYCNEMESYGRDDVDIQEESIRRPGNKDKVTKNVKRKSLVENLVEYPYAQLGTQSSTTSMDDARSARLRSLRSSQPPTSRNTTAATPSSSTPHVLHPNPNSASGPSTPRPRPRTTTVFPQTPLNPSPSTLPSPIRTNASEIAEVREFLASCNPPMTHLLSRFLAFGCRNAVFIGAVARFPEDRISEFADKLSNQGALDGERDLSGTEKMVLKLRFLEYKNRISKS